MPTHLNVLLKLVDLPVLNLSVEFHLAVLPLELLDEERLYVVGLLADRESCASVSRCEICLLLECAGQILDVLLLLHEVDVQLFGLRAEARVLIPRNVVLDLQVAIHISEVFLLSLAEDGCLIGLDHV